MPTQSTQPARPPAADNPFEQFQWKPQPEAERLVRGLVEQFVEVDGSLRAFRDRLYAEAGVRLVHLVDVIPVPEGASLRERLRKGGYVQDHEGVHRHEGGIFPPVVLREVAVRQMA